MIWPVDESEMICWNFQGFRAVTIADHRNELTTKLCLLSISQTDDIPHWISQTSKNTGSNRIAVSFAFSIFLDFIEDLPIKMNEHWFSSFIFASDDKLNMSIAMKYWIDLFEVGINGFGNVRSSIVNLLN